MVDIMVVHLSTNIINANYIVISIDTIREKNAFIMAVVSK